MSNDLGELFEELQHDRDALTVAAAEALRLLGDMNSAAFSGEYAARIEHVKARLRVAIDNSLATQNTPSTEHGDG